MLRDKAYYTVDEVASEYGVTTAAVRDWINKKKLMAYQPSGERGVYRIPAAAIRVFELRRRGVSRESQGPATVIGATIDLWRDRIQPVLDETHLTGDELLRRMAIDPALVARYPSFATDYAAYVVHAAEQALRMAHA